MISLRPWLVAAAAFPVLAGCGGDSERHENATGGNAMTNAMKADPFAQSELAMLDAMETAVGTDVSDTWAHKMIEYHRGAIGMADELVARGGDAAASALAEQMKEEHARAAKELQQLLGKTGADHGSALPYERALDAMHQAMMAAKGASISETWVLKMIEHHRGAIALTHVLLEQPDVPDNIRAIAEKTASDQAREIAALERLTGNRPGGNS